MVRRTKIKHQRKSIRRIWKYLLWIFLTSLIITAVGGGVYILSVVNSLPPLDQFSSRHINQTTKLYDREGKILLYEIHGEEKRTLVPFSEIPEALKSATLAAEDTNFYHQPAFNWRAMVRALLTNLKSGRIAQGGSTIGQQLVKNVFLTPERTFSRKIKELILAIELESRYNKDQIFSFYLNQIPYGSNAYGVEAASQTYFNKSVRDLTLAEAATIASLPKAPSYYSPWGTHAAELTERKNYILNRMAEFKLIDLAERDAAKEEVLKFATPNMGEIKAPHFSLAVKDYLINRFGEDVVMNGGLKVITTLDWKLQELAERVVKEGAARNEELYQSKNAALIAQDPKTGQLLALVGSRDYFDTANGGNFNVATQGLRQPGSALKPFVYLTALQKGYNPKTILFDVPTEFDTRKDPTTSYKPENFDERFRGPVSLEQALAQSINVPAVKTLYLAGFDDTLKNLHRFGITTLKERWRYGLSLTLGGGEVKLIDLVGAYTVLSQEGVHHRQTMVVKVEDSRGNILEEYNDKTERVIDAEYPRLINQILSDIDLRAPLYEQSLPLTIFSEHEVALKTGTTEDYRDAWALGYTQSLTVGVWAGNNDNAPMVRKGSSILAAVPMWSAFLKEAVKNYPPEVFEKPEPLILPPKPMLNGLSEFTPVIAGKKYPQLHSILYYVDRGDPLGQPPPNPAEDSQFENWETGVIEWARMNMLNFYLYNAPLPSNIDFNQPPIIETGSGPSYNTNIITINNTKPNNGAFVTTPFTISANIESGEPLAKIELYLNKNLINRVEGFSNQKNYYYQNLVGELPEPQNSIEIKASNKSGKEATVSIIVFH
ncbi:PBP1A family penicillin-binding protein [Candidatus Jorgensenbacteria bacterium]|nr:PBP1A family penicillin-binding protein [Candidatus Jorgensenbacteria bacterium]